jgi:hypothetical protein
VKFEHLEELQLSFCKDYGCLLLELTRLPLKLKSFCVDEQDTMDLQFDDNTNIFLRSLKPLERISLALDPDLGSPDTKLDWCVVETHASTLKYLRVEAYIHESLFPTESSITAFERLCKSADNLEQLAISGLSEYNDSDGELGITRFLVRPT